MTRLILADTDLRPALALVKSAIPKEGVVHARVRHSVLELSGNDPKLGIGLSIPIPCEGDGDGVTMTFPIAAVLAFARAAPKKASIIIEPTAHDTRLSHGGGVLTLPIVEHPVPLEGLPEPGTGTVFGPDLVAALDRVSRCASRDSYRPILTGVLFEPRSDGSLVVTACDNHRLASETVRPIHGWSSAPVVVLPIEAIDLLLRVAKGADHIEVIHSPGKAHFVSDHGTITSQLIHGSYPNYEPIIPIDVATRVTFQPGPLVTALKMIVKTGRPGRQGGQSVHLTIGDTLRLTALYDGNKATAEVDAKATGPAMVIAFDAGFLLDVISMLQGTGSMGFNGPLAPALITCGDLPGLRLALMPRRTAEVLQQAK